VGYSNSLEQFANAVLAGDSEVTAYTNNYVGVHAGALGNIYPAVQRLLGDDGFKALANVYAHHFAPSAWDINQYGEQFNVLLEAQAQGARAEYIDWRALALVASVEHMIAMQYYAEDSLGEEAHVTSLVVEKPLALQPDWIDVLMECHPYARIDIPEQLEGSLVFWRDDLIIRVLALAEPLVKQLTGSDDASSDAR